MPVLADPAPDSITLQTAMTPDDYARYFAVMRRRDAGWISLAFYAGTFFTAIPVALVFRSIGQHFSIASADADLIGKFSLFAFVLGAITMTLAGEIARRLAIRDYVEGALNALEPKTVVLDGAGVTVTGQLSHTHWRWAAINRLTLASGLMLLRVAGRTPFVIPDRSFAGAAERDAAIAFIRARLSETAYGSPPSA
jgi:hypothetical protein